MNRRHLHLLGPLAALVVLSASGCSITAEDRPWQSGSEDTLFGASFQRDPGEDYSEALNRAEGTLGLDVVRVYYPGPPDPWPGVAPDRALVVSFKIDPQEVLSGEHDAEMTQWFRSAPTDQSVHWVYWHEPEDESEAGLFEPEEFRRAFAHLSSLARGADNPRLHATVVLMSYSLTPESGRRWRDWFPPEGSVDVLAWDVYNRGNRQQFYPSPAELIGPLQAASASVGKPYAIAEIASPLAPGDAGADRARWITAVGCHLVATDARFAAWFDFLWNDGEDDYRLDDPQSSAAWRDLSGLRPDDDACGGKVLDSTHGESARDIRWRDVRGRTAYRGRRAGSLDQRQEGC